MYMCLASCTDDDDHDDDDEITTDADMEQDSEMCTCGIIPIGDDVATIDTDVEQEV